MKPEWTASTIANPQVMDAINLLAQRSKEVRECSVEGCCEGLIPTTRFGIGGESHPAVRPCECRRNALAAFHELKQIAGGGWSEYVTFRMADWTPEKRLGVSDPSRFHKLEQEARRAMGGMSYELPGEMMG